jgi:hypothetical protein
MFGCIARKAAVAADTVCPGFRRSITVSNIELVEFIDARGPRTSDSAPNGIATSNG